MVLINVAVIAVARRLHWPLVMLLWPYWVQSLIIGAYSVWRILALRRFSLENTAGFDRGSDGATKRGTALFFVGHYGLFHLVYFFFLAFATSGEWHGVPGYDVTHLDRQLMAALALGFAITHYASYARIIASDRVGRPNIAGVMFLPYLRIAPMHAAILIGLGVGQGQGVLVFGALKTIADVAMHWIEHRITLPKVESSA